MTALQPSTPPASPRKAAGAGKLGRPSAARIASRDQELLDRALDLFLAKGFDGTTIEAISDAIAMSPRTIYARFRDKDALFMAALQRAAIEWTVPVDRLRAASSDDFAADLLAVARLLVASQTSVSGQRLTHIANIEAFRRPEIGAYLWDRTALPAIDFLTELFRTRLLTCEMDPASAREAAETFMIMVVNGAFQSLTWDLLPPGKLDHQVETRTRMFLAGARAIYEGQHDRALSGHSA